MALYIDQTIMFLVGAYATGVGFGWVSSPAKGPAAADWQRRYGRLFKFLGPVLLVISVALALAEYASANPLSS